MRDLEAWASATEKELEEIRAEMVPLEERMAAARERLDLIRRLIGLAEGGMKSPAPMPSATTKINSEQASVPSGVDIEAQLVGILKEAGQPLHIKALREALIERGVPLPGRGDEANIIVRLRRDEGQFTRTGRGMYALTAWGLPAVNPTRRRKVRPRKAARR